jgi:hypothetical protein
LRRHEGIYEEVCGWEAVESRKGWEWWEEKGKVVMAQRQSKGQVAGWRTGYTGLYLPLPLKKKGKNKTGLCYCLSLYLDYH